MFKIKRNPKEESAVKAPEATTEQAPDVIKTLSSSMSSKMTLKRNPMRTVYFKAAKILVPQPEIETDTFKKESDNQHLQLKERVSSISSINLPSNKNVIPFLASICLYSLYSMILQNADAQFSPVSTVQTNQYTINQKQLPSEIRMIPFGNNQPGQQSIVSPGSVQGRSFVSIDRFDSGDQIRPPLLGQPTTLAPSSKPQQVSAYQQGNFNLEASASDSAYLTPEERDQLLRQQENHYEGRSDGEKSSYQRGDGPSGDNYSKSPSGSLKDSSSNLDEQPQRVLENRSLQSDATNNAADANDSNDPDYDQDDEPQQQQQKKRVPGRRGDGGATNKETENRRTMHANDNGDESEPNDDFGGVNDDAYFNRQPNSGSGSSSSGLNHAASQHQTKGSSNANQYDRSNARSNYNPDDQVNDGKQTTADEGQGFGPGPNEAYLADQAESSGKAGVDSEDGGEASMVNDMDGGKVDRRSSKGDAKLNPSLTSGATKVTAASPQQDSYGAGEDDDSDADEATDSSEDSFIPSLNAPEAGSKSQAGSQTVAGEAASAATAAVATAASTIENVRSTLNGNPTPTVAINSRIITTKPILPLFGIQRQQHQPSGQTTQQLMQQPALQQQIPVSGSNQQYLNSVGAKHHKSAFNAGYNPQNNPSHIGKFFIN